MHLEIRKNYDIFAFKLCNVSNIKKKKNPAWRPWLMPVILATQEAEIKRITV
jgi:hypothetical protein